MLWTLRQLIAALNPLDDNPDLDRIRQLAEKGKVITCSFSPETATLYKRLLEELKQPQLGETQKIPSILNEFKEALQKELSARFSKSSFDLRIAAILEKHRNSFQAVARMLAEEGIPVVYLSREELLKTEAVEQLFSLIVLEDSPEQSSEETIHHLKDNFATEDIPLVVYGDPESPTALNALRAGAIDVLGPSTSAESAALKLKNFVLSFAPLSLIPERPPAAQAAVPHQPEDAGKPPNKVLFVDPNKTLREIVSRRYRNMGIKVYLATSGEEALKVFKEVRPSLVVTDLVMPGMDGDVLIRALKEIDPSVKVIILTSQQLDSYLIRAEEAGADDYLRKPFSPVELDYKIRKSLNITRQKETSKP